MSLCASLLAMMSLTVGLETDLLTEYVGSYAPAGVVSASVASYGDLFGVRAAVGGFEASQPHLALSLEGSGATAFTLGDDWSLAPHVGLALARSKPYQRMTDRSYVGPNGEHMDTYEVADVAQSNQVFVGARLLKRLSERGSLTFGAGLLHEYRFMAHGYGEKDIRNCYADACPDSHVSGGGQWPDPKNAFYLTVGYEFDALGARP